LLRRFILTALAPIKDHPALHSICLSNEPVNQEEPCEPARQQWRTWLEKRHGTPTELNSLCGSNFAAFADAPLPNPFGSRPAPALWMDYIRFNQDFFADWHRMLADAVHEVAPGLPVHAKAMTWTLLEDGEVKYGVDATLFARFSDINGNDSVNFFEFGDGEFAQGWQLNAMGHDLQRSVLDAPVFNTGIRYYPRGQRQAGEAAEDQGPQGVMPITPSNIFRISLVARAAAKNRSARSSWHSARRLRPRWPLPRAASSAPSAETRKRRTSCKAAAISHKGNKPQRNLAFDLRAL
jgi:hypothetical protein